MALNLLGSRAWRDALQIETRHLRDAGQERGIPIFGGFDEGRIHVPPCKRSAGPGFSLIASPRTSLECRSAFGSGRDELFRSTF